VQSFRFLEVVEALGQLDPVRTYPARGAACVAELVAASSYELQLAAARSADGNGDGSAGELGPADVGAGGAVALADDAAAAPDEAAQDEADDARPSSPPGAGPDRSRLTLPLRAGRRVLGALHLVAPLTTGRFTVADVRLARWAARVFGRHLDHAQRLADDPRKRRAESVDEVLARTPLTPRERDVVALLLGGTSTREIARRTGLTSTTVHTYLKRIYPKLGVHSRVELVARLAGPFGPPASGPF
jgi:DNA-binding CsgD family transcriptional regulator